MENLEQSNELRDLSSRISSDKKEETPDAITKMTNLKKLQDESLLVKKVDSVLTLTATTIETPKRSVELRRNR